MSSSEYTVHSEGMINSKSIFVRNLYDIRISSDVIFYSFTCCASACLSNFFNVNPRFLSTSTSDGCLSP